MPLPSRITYLNPHADDFVSTPVSFALAGRRALRKYSYLLDEPIRRGDEISVLVDGTMSSLIDQQYFVELPSWLRRAILAIEVTLWAWINGLRGKIVVYWTAESVPDRSLLYLFSYKNCVGAFSERRATIEKFRRAVINMSHYFIRTGEKASNISSLSNAVLVAESDLTHNRYFRKFFPDVRSVVVVPFAIAPRFSVRRPVADRTRICAATGSFHALHAERPQDYYRDFVDFFTIDTYHPVRKLLYQSRKKNADWLDSRISYYRELTEKGGWLARARGALGLDFTQSGYFSFDMVEFYNEHRFAVVGEELSGAPAIGFFEAMACGCVMLGEDGAFYDGLSLKPGKHYLLHDGTLEGIRHAIEQCLAEPGRLESVSEAGISYIATHCTSKAAWDTLMNSLSVA